MEICRKIFDAVCEISEKIESPVAYINLTVGKNFAFKDEDFFDCFKKMKWDSQISASDLVIKHGDDSDFLVRIEEIVEFMDENGQSKSYFVDSKKALIRSPE